MYNPKVEEIMTLSPCTLHPNDSVNKVDDLFWKNNFHHLPVVNEDGEVVGMVSKSDYFLLCSHRTLFLKNGEQERNLNFFRTLLVEEIMTKPVVTLDVNDRVAVAVAHFKGNQFHAIPVVDSQKKLLGIITPMDLIDYAYHEFKSLGVKEKDMEEVD